MWYIIKLNYLINPSIFPNELMYKFDKEIKMYGTNSRYYGTISRQNMCVLVKWLL